jgi:hypothetical protein
MEVPSKVSKRLPESEKDPLQFQDIQAAPRRVPRRQSSQEKLEDKSISGRRKARTPFADARELRTNRKVTLDNSRQPLKQRSLMVSTSRPIQIDFSDEQVRNHCFR